MLQDLHGYDVSLDFNIDIAVDHGICRSDSRRITSTGVITRVHIGFRVWIRTANISLAHGGISSNCEAKKHSQDADDRRKARLRNLYDGLWKVLNANMENKVNFSLNKSNIRRTCSSPVRTQSYPYISWKKNCWTRTARSVINPSQVLSCILAGLHYDILFALHQLVRALPNHSKAHMGLTTYPRRYFGWVR